MDGDEILAVQTLRVSYFRRRVYAIQEVHYVVQFKRINFAYDEIYWLHLIIAESLALSHSTPEETKNIRDHA